MLCSSAIHSWVVIIEAYQAGGSSVKIGAADAIEVRMWRGLLAGDGLVLQCHVLGHPAVMITLLGDVCIEFSMEVIELGMQSLEALLEGAQRPELGLRPSITKHEGERDNEQIAVDVAGAPRGTVGSVRNTGTNVSGRMLALLTTAPASVLLCRERGFASLTQTGPMTASQLVPPAPIVGLLFGCSPATVSWTIVTVIVDPIDGVV